MENIGIDVHKRESQICMIPCPPATCPRSVMLSHVEDEALDTERFDEPGDVLARRG